MKPLLNKFSAAAALGVFLALFYRAPQRGASVYETSLHKAHILSECPALLRADDRLYEIINSTHEASASYGVEPELIYAVMMVESRCKPEAKSRAGAQGLMQLMPGTARWLGVNDPYAIRSNVHGGAKYLAYLLDKFHGDVRRALTAYNAGPARVKRNEKWSCHETRRYVERVLAKYEALRGRKGLNAA